MTTKRKATKSSKAAKKPKSATNRSARSALSIGTSARRTVKERVEALAEAPLAVCGSDENLQALLNVLREKNEPIEVRLAALQSVAAASFSVVAFESCRGDYIATLREVAVDPDPELRRLRRARERDCGLAYRRALVFA